MRVAPFLQLCASLLCLVNGRGEPSAQEGLLPGNSLARGCGDQQADRSLYVSTIDGGLTALDEQGHTLWTYQASTPLFYSSLSPTESEEVSERIVPSLDGGMYHWNGDKLTQLPFSADDLIDHAQLLKRPGGIVAGAKATDIVGVNIHTGKPIYECSHEKCHRYDNQSLIHRMDILKLSTSRVTVREASDLTGEEMWNFTVGSMQLMLVEGEDEREGEGGGQSCGVFQDLKWELHADVLGGVVYTTGVSNSDHRLWEVELGVPVVRAWLHQGGKLEPLPLSSSSSSEYTDPSLMMVHYGNQYYLQPLHWKGEGKGQKAWLQLERETEGQSGQDIGRPAEDDHTLASMFPRHYSLAPDMLTVLAENSEGKSESALMLYYDQDTFSEMCTTGPYGLAVYFYADLLPHTEYNVSDGNQQECSLPPDPIPYQETGWWQWLFTRLLSAIKYVVFAAFVLTCNKLRRHIKSQCHRNSSTSSSADLVNDEEFPLFDKLVGTFRRHSSQTESGSTLLPRSSSIPNSSTETLVSYSRANSVPEPRVLPRFGSDYELKGRLGKGGFGVVYHVQNKTDGGEYAVKRIKLPPGKAAREKVMREVRALAQLDHPRIVRYFNSWVEKAPMGWNQMEEWMPLSRRGSYIQELGEPASSSVLPSSSVGRSSPSLYPPHAHMGGQSSSISPCPSFNSLSHSNIHSIIPPSPFTADSRSSSFVIEFRDESDQPAPASGSCDDHVTSDHWNSQLLNGHGASDSKPASGLTVENKSGCFSRALLRDRDDLSSAGDSESTQHRDEGRDSVADLGVEPPTYLFIQMQLCRKESLKDWLKSNISGRCHGKVMHFFDQILDAVRYVHSKGMMHRDLKPSNIFFSLDGTIKVGDFGLVTSSAYGGLRNSYVALKGLAEEQPHRQHTGNLGTHFYMSPEQMSGHKYDHKVDIYSLGIILFELHYPFQTDMERAKVLENVRKHKFPSNFETKLPRQAELVKWLMADLASNRPVAEDIYASSTFKKLQDNVMETIPLL